MNMISIKKRKRSIDTYYLYVVFIVFLTFINSRFAHISQITALLAMAETFYLIYALIGKNISDFTISALIILSTNIENIKFALGGKTEFFYSVYILPYVKSYLLLFIMLAAAVKAVVIYGFPVSMKKRDGLRKFFFLNIIMFCIAALMTFITFALNDNEIFSHSDMWRYTARDMYEIIHVAAFVILGEILLHKQPGFAERLRTVMPAVLSGVTWAAVLLILTGNTYAIWGDEYYITCPLILFFAPGLILFLFEEQGIFHFVTGCLALLIQLRYTVGIAGTWWIYILFVGIVFVRKMLTFHDTRVRVGIKFGLVLILLCMGYVVLHSGAFQRMEGQISYKLSTALRIFDNNGSILDWYANLGGSIQTRIEGVINVIIEVFQKPWSLLFGKGYGGTAVKYWGLSDWNISGSTFADTMIQYQTYSHFHLPFAEIIINFGLSGVVLITFMLKEFIAEFLKKDGNMWIILGVLWFVFFYSLYYSFNLGIMWICYGLHMKDRTGRGGCAYRNQYGSAELPNVAGD